MRVLACPDKFRGTATAVEIAKAVAAAASDAGWDCDVQPMADGGEGTLEAFGGANRTTAVTGPDGSSVQAEWHLSGKLAVIEMARASGLDLVGGAELNDAMEATTAGT
ncbi:MAG: glycerate kinase, partial [Acidimicrobiaceae bacterium]|nr:glycerate kinase [Acidimicrobiaceae bacterium]